MNIVLPDTSLCAIVCDEMSNPAGGIKDFIESTVPHVEQAVILDTGSRDGTKEKLEELQSKYPHLIVYHSDFYGFALSRNLALEHVQTKMALVLDADERLTLGDFRVLKELLAKKLSPAYSFGFLCISPSGAQERCKGHNPRLFQKKKNTAYLGDYQEILMGYDPKRFFPTGIEIKHFLPSEEGISVKDEQYYRYIYATVDDHKKGLSRRDIALGKHIRPLPIPSQFADFETWKKLNPQRENYR